MAWPGIFSSFSLVSIPFREFKCCRERISRCLRSKYVRFQSLSGNSSVVGSVNSFPHSLILKFQSLSGNSSVVGSADRPQGWQLCSGVSIPFREFKCCRGQAQPRPHVLSFRFQSLSGNSSVVGGVTSPASRSLPTGFNPFQGIQVLSDALSKQQNDRSFVSIPFREFKCCRTEG